MNDRITIREIRTIVRSTLEEMKLGLASYRMDPTDHIVPTDLGRERSSPMLPRPTTVQFKPDRYARASNARRQRWSKDDETDPEMLLRALLEPDDETDEFDSEVADDLRKI